MSLESLGRTLAWVLSSRPSPDERTNPTSRSIAIALSTIVSDKQEGESIGLKGKEIEVLPDRMLELPGDVQWEILRRFDLNDLVYIGILSKGWYRIFSDPRLWRAIATEIECPIDPSSSKSMREQVIDFIKEIKEEAEAIPNKTPGIERILREPLTVANFKILHQCVKFGKKNRDQVVGYQLLILTVHRQMVRQGIPIPGWAQFDYLDLNPEFGPEKLDSLMDKEAQMSADVEVLFVQGRFRNFSKLHLGGRSLSSIPSFVFRMKNLRVLDLSGSGFTKLPEELWTLQNLEKLNLNGNRLTTLSSDIVKLQNLEDLDLGRNQLTTLPVELWTLQNLEKLNLDRNRLTTLCSDIDKLQSLRVLSLQENQLTTLPSEIANLHKPQPGNMEMLDLVLEIDVSDNPLESIPREIYDNPRIKFIRSEVREAFHQILPFPTRFIEKYI